MGQVSTVGQDLAKNIFQAHGADASGKVVFRKKLGRGRLLALFAGLPACVESGLWMQTQLRPQTFWSVFP
jgi:transposase